MTSAPPIDPLEDKDPLGPHRDRMMLPMAIAGAIFLTPFALYDFYISRWLLGGAVMAVVVAFALDAVAIHRKRRPPIPYPVLLVPMIASMGLSLAEREIYGAMWAFPAVLFFYFVLPRVLANIGSVTMLTAAAIFVYNFFGFDVAVRFVICLALTIVVINIVVSVIRRLQQELMDLAVTDPLTGAFNRRHMEANLIDTMESFRRYGSPASILLVDIDHFKKVNDTHGHNVGDSVLKGLVAAITQRGRRLDRMFRLGGEEFMVLLPNTRGGDAIVHAEILRKLVADSELLPGHPVTVSIGVAELAGDPTREEWVRRADEALYTAKRTGRNRVVFAPPREPEPANIAIPA